MRTQWNQGAQVWLVHSHRDIDACRKILKDQNVSDREARFRTLNTDDFEAKVGIAPEATILDMIEIDHPNKDYCRYVTLHLIFVCLPRKYSTKLKHAQQCTLSHYLSFAHAPNQYTHPPSLTLPHAYPTDPELPDR